MRQTYFYFNRPGERGLPEGDLSALDQAGFPLDLRRVVMDREYVSVPALTRPGFRKLLSRLESGDGMVVCELSALGCSARDVAATLDYLRDADVAVHCPALGAANLAHRHVPPMIRLLNGLVDLETAVNSERVQRGIEAARERGAQPGRPASLDAQTRQAVLASLADGASVSDVARRFGTSRQTVMRIRANGAPEHDPVSET